MLLRVLLQRICVSAGLELFEQPRRFPTEASGGVSCHVDQSDVCLSQMVKCRYDEVTVAR